MGPEKLAREVGLWARMGVPTGSSAEHNTKVLEFARRLLETQVCIISTISSDGAAAVDPNYFWKKCDSNTPRGVKLQLINKAAGVAVYGMWSPGCGFTHWAPLPKFAPGD